MKTLISRSRNIKNVRKYKATYKVRLKKTMRTEKEEDGVEFTVKYKNVTGELDEKCVYAMAASNYFDKVDNRSVIATCIILTILLVIFPHAAEFYPTCLLNSENFSNRAVFEVIAIFLICFLTGAAVHKLGKMIFTRFNPEKYEPESYVDNYITNNLQRYFDEGYKQVGNIKLNVSKNTDN